MRVLVGMVLVLLILVIVVSPYVDLPLSTLGARQAAILILGVLALCWAAVAGWHGWRRAERVSSQELDLRGLPDRHLLGRTCALLC